MFFWNSYFHTNYTFQFLEFKDENGVEHLPEDETMDENNLEGDSDTVPCKVRKLSGENEVHNHVNGDTVDPKEDVKKELTAPEPEFVFNSDLLCSHGKWIKQSLFSL